MSARSNFLQICKMYKIDLLFNDIFYPEICNINSKHRLKSLAKTIFCVESDKNLQVTGQTWKDFVILQLQC